MAIGRNPAAQSGPRDGYMTAVAGRDRRLPPPPAGDVYLRDPEAARAQAIRDRVALHKSLGRPVPPYLQGLYDQLPPEVADVELVDAATGEHVAEVTLVDPPLPVPEPKSAPEPEPEPEPLVVEEVPEVKVADSVDHGGVGTLSAAAAPVVPTPPSAPAPPPVAPAPTIPTPPVAPIQPTAPLPPRPPMPPAARRPGRPRKG